ncbi:unnamed protein product [Ixodes persulcatus]
MAKGIRTPWNQPLGYFLFFLLMEEHLPTFCETSFSNDVTHSNEWTGCLPNHLFQIPQFSQGFPADFDKMLTVTSVQGVVSGLRCLVACRATLFSAAAPTCNHRALLNAAVALSLIILTDLELLVWFP